MNGSAPKRSLTGSQSVPTTKPQPKALSDHQADQDAEAHQRQQERGQVEDAIAEQTDVKGAHAGAARWYRYILTRRFKKISQGETVCVDPYGPAPSPLKATSLCRQT
jgi:hypothetical protein